MILNKYSESRDGSTVIGSYADRSSSSSSVSSSSSASVNRELWGQDDTGDDIDGSMTVNGNIYLGEVTYDDEEEDDDGDGVETGSPRFSHEFPSEEGNLYAGGSVESPQVYGKDLYLDIAGVKTNLIDLLMPVGSVIMFDGRAEPPANWALCDGSNGTPDLRNRFIKGAETAKDVGKTGGSSEVSLSNVIPRHTHQVYNYLTQVHGNDEIFENSTGHGAITIGGKEVTVGRHQASRDPTRRADTSDSGYSDIPYILHETEPAGVETDAETKANIEPPFYSLVFIMRIK